MSTETPTHDELVKHAGRWLQNTLRCGVVLMESSGGGLEIPDAIGWRRGWESHMIECKASRSDFLADAKKPFRGPEDGVGLCRWYFAPEGIISKDELQDGWGLLEYRIHRLAGTPYVKQVRTATERTLSRSSMCREINMLVSALRKVKIGAFIVAEAVDLEANQAATEEE